MRRETFKSWIALVVAAVSLGLLIWDSQCERAGGIRTVSAQSGMALQPGGKVTVSGAGTRVQLTSTITRANGIYIEADEDNSGTIYIGNITVGSDSYITRLTNGQGWSWSSEQGGALINPSSVYIDASTNTQSVQWGFY